MKKVAFLIILILVLGVFSSCASSMLYKVETKEIRDIDGVINITSMPVYVDNWAMWYFDMLSISKVQRGNVEFYRFEVEVWLSDWLFIDTLRLKINDGETISLVDNNPSRKVIPGTVGNAYSMSTPTRVHEVAYFLLNENIVNELKNCNSITFQHKTQLVTLPPEAITAIKNFLNK